MPEFHPPQLRSRARFLLGLGLLPIVVLPVVLAGPLLWGRPRIVYSIDRGRLTVSTGGLFDRERSVPLGRSARGGAPS